MKFLPVIILFGFLFHAGCKSRRTNESFLAENNDEDSGAEGFESGAVPVIIRDRAKMISIGDRVIAIFQAPIGYREKSEKALFLDRALIASLPETDGHIIVLLSYPGFTRGQLPVDAQITGEIWSESIQGSQSKREWYDDQDALATAIEKYLGTRFTLSLDGLALGENLQPILAKDAMAKLGIDEKKLSTKFVAIKEVVFDNKHSQEEQLGIRSREYSVLEHAVSQPMNEASLKTLGNILKLRRLTVEEMLAYIQDSKLQEKVTKDYQQDFPADEAEFSEFQSPMDDEIDGDMMKLLRAINSPGS